MDAFEGSSQADLNKIVKQTKQSLAAFEISDEKIRAAFDPFLEGDPPMETPQAKAPKITIENVSNISDDDLEARKQYLKNKARSK